MGGDSGVQDADATTLWRWVGRSPPPLALYRPIPHPRAHMFVRARYEACRRLAVFSCVSCSFTPTPHAKQASAARKARQSAQHTNLSHYPNTHPIAALGPYQIDASSSGRRRARDAVAIGVVRRQGVVPDVDRSRAHDSHHVVPTRSTLDAAPPLGFPSILPTDHGESVVPGSGGRRISLARPGPGYRRVRVTPLCDRVRRGHRGRGSGRSIGRPGRSGQRCGAPLRLGDVTAPLQAARPQPQPRPAHRWCGDSTIAVARGGSLRYRLGPLLQPHVGGRRRRRTPSAARWASSARSTARPRAA